MLIIVSVRKGSAPMPRPCCLRRIGFKPCADFFKPAGVPVHALELVTLALDEVEALRLADLNGLYQEQAAEQMKISRATFARIVEEARKKVADALIHGKALRLEGGTVVMKGDKTMPARNRTPRQGSGQAGPVGGGQGMRQGPCGCGQRHGAQGQGGQGRRRRRMACCEVPTAVKPEVRTSKDAERGKVEA